MQYLGYILIIHDMNQIRFPKQLKRSVHAFFSQPHIFNTPLHHARPLPAAALPAVALAAPALAAPALAAPALAAPPFFPPSTASPAADSASPTAPAPAADVMDPASSRAPPVAPAAPPFLPPLGARARLGFFFFSASPLPSTASPAAESASPTSSAPAPEVMPPARSRAPPTMPGTSCRGVLREFEGFLGYTVSASGSVVDRTCFEVLTLVPQRR